jgi:predicted metal-dependent hydrolase
VVLEDGGAELVVGGEAPHLPRRIKDWLRGEARRVIAPIAYEKAAKAGRRIKRFSIRDSRTRWGSCSSSGALSFSWRLVLTPQHIVDYVAAHEAAHLIELNHSARFWQRCAELADHDIAPSRAWLRKNGGAILAVY